MKNDDNVWRLFTVVNFDPYPQPYGGAVYFVPVEAEHGYLTNENSGIPTHAHMFPKKVMVSLGYPNVVRFARERIQAGDKFMATVVAMDGSFSTYVVNASSDIALSHSVDAAEAKLHGIAQPVTIDAIQKIFTSRNPASLN